jgi:hypothetical protein
MKENLTVTLDRAIAWIIIAILATYIYGTTIHEQYRREELKSLRAIVKGFTPEGTVNYFNQNYLEKEEKGGKGNAGKAKSE